MPVEVDREQLCGRGELCDVGVGRGRAERRSLGETEDDAAGDAGRARPCRRGGGTVRDVVPLMSSTLSVSVRPRSRAVAHSAATAEPVRSRAREPIRPRRRIEHDDGEAARPVRFPIRLGRRLRARPRTPLRRSRRGARRALGRGRVRRAVRPLRRVAYGLALRVLRDEALAEDAVQDAFLAIWRGASRFIPERGKASTWILTLVHRRAVDLVRRENRRRTEPLEESEPTAGGASVEDIAWLRLERERVQAALRKLPDPQREAIELAYYGGFTQSELAERLGQPLGTIKSRMFAGLTRLRELLEAPGERRGMDSRRPPRADRRLRARRARRAPSSAPTSSTSRAASAARTSSRRSRPPRARSRSRSSRPSRRPRSASGSSRPRAPSARTSSRSGRADPRRGSSRSSPRSRASRRSALGVWNVVLHNRLDRAHAQQTALRAAGRGGLGRRRRERPGHARRHRPPPAPSPGRPTRRG